jgi:F0F1-type ATP synthase epsilon subunit
MNSVKPNLLRVEVLSVAGTVLELENIHSIKVLLEDGSSIGILPGHAPLIGATADGLLFYNDEDGKKSVYINEGVLTVRDNLVSILTTH